jgi:hypothetical protein
VDNPFIFLSGDFAPLNILGIMVFVSYLEFCPFGLLAGFKAHLTWENSQQPS